MFFETSEIDTPRGLRPAVSLSEIAGVPVSGTGLYGRAYAPGDSIWSISKLREVMLEGGPDLRFTASALDYRGGEAEESIAAFLGEDAATVTGGDAEALVMGPTGMAFSGFVYIPEGVHEITVRSDDGFSLKLGGVTFSHYENGRGEAPTSRVAEFEGGLYRMELLYFDGGGNHGLGLEIDGLKVDQSAFYRTKAEFAEAVETEKLIPTARYHPSHFLGEHMLDGKDTMTGNKGRDEMDGEAGPDILRGAAGDDSLFGNYGDDRLHGGDGNDILDGGRGSDILYGGDGDDLLIARSDAGEQRIGQLAVGKPTRPDPDDEVNMYRQKLKGWENQPKTGDDILVGGEGRDTFLITSQINAKLDIIRKHVGDDGLINWARVAGENNELHDHWVDSTGIDMIADFKKGEDHIAIIGHTANVHVEHRDTDGDGDEESIVTVISRQHGNGGAHDMDLIGQVIVHGDRVEAEDIKTDANVTYGIVEGEDGLAEALFPAGKVKKTEIGGNTVWGYDSRDGDKLGAIVTRPEKFMDNPFKNGVKTADPSRMSNAETTRGHFEPLRLKEAAGLKERGTGDDDVMSAGMGHADDTPAALGFWSFADEGDGSFSNARKEPDARAYTLHENQALLRTDGAVEGPGGTPGGALHFDGESDFAFIDHDEAYQFSQGTVALWIRPDDLSRDMIVLSKDQEGQGEGGHFRLGITEDGGLFMRFAEGDGGSNKSWETAPRLLDEGEWAHVAVSFTGHGIQVYLDGQSLADYYWTPVEGNVPTPGHYMEAYLTMNAEPWVIGADTDRTRINDTAAAFATDDEDLDDPFEGAIADFGIWGGFDHHGALDKDQVRTLYRDGPDDFLTGMSGVQPLQDARDRFTGGNGDDRIDGKAGDDLLFGGNGNDLLIGGYGEDVLDGGRGNDRLEGGRGSDLMLGGDGNDLLISRADAGEQRAGQLVLDEPSRPFPDPSISKKYLKLIDWIDQPLVADDILVGGAGRDLFYFEPQINAKLDIILEHVNDDRTIDWGGVAGENDRIHDHWVDALGIEIIADYNAMEDTIAVVGHTSVVEVEYRLTDTNRDGFKDKAVSVITVTSQQGDNGGAHDEDMIGYIVVHGDLVREEDIITNAGSHYGVVRTIDEVQEAIAPTGNTKRSVDARDNPLFGYDSRDKAGNPIGSNPEAFSSNRFIDHRKVIYEDGLGDAAPVKTLYKHGGRAFDGTDDYFVIPHKGAFARDAGTWALSFTAHTPGEGDQALISKDHSGYLNGGHMHMWIDGSGFLRVRFQSDEETRELKYHDAKIEAGREYHVAFSYDAEDLKLFVDGELVDAEDGFEDGMLANDLSAVLGASTTSRMGADQKLHAFFDGRIGDVLAVDRALSPVEALLLADAGGDVEVLRNMPEESQSSATREDRITGTDGDDVLSGDGGTAERIIGKDGDDVLNGMGGADRIVGGRGADEMTGGNGADIFDYRSEWHSGATLATADRITDFVSGEDMIDLSMIDAVAHRDGNQRLRFTEEFDGIHGQITITEGEAGQSFLQIDFDGDAMADFIVEIRGDAVLESDLIL